MGVQRVSSALLGHGPILEWRRSSLGHQPTESVEGKTRIVLSVLRSEISIAAAPTHGTHPLRVPRGGHRRVASSRCDEIEEEVQEFLQVAQWRLARLVSLVHERLEDYGAEMEQEETSVPCRGMVKLPNWGGGPSSHTAEPLAVSWPRTLRRPNTNHNWSCDGAISPEEEALEGYG